MTKREQRILDQATATLNSDIEEVLKSLAKAGLGPAYGIKLLRQGFGIPLREAKRIVHYSEAWAHMREDIEKLHDDAEAALEAESNR